MSARPLIGITCGTGIIGPGIDQDRLNRAYSRAVIEAGGLPVILPVLAHQDTAEYLDVLDGLLLSGGADIDPALYGESILNDSVEVDRARDEFEIPLVRAAVGRDMPILGVCRGIQTLNVALGGSLVQDLETQRLTDIGHRQQGKRSDLTHSVEIVPCSVLEVSLGTNCMQVNSLHHQAIARVADDLRVTSWAPDGIVEGIEIPGARYTVAVQFHPEELTGLSEEARRLFAAFVSAAG